MTEATVGLVVVSHSRALAAAAIELAEEMLHGSATRIEEAAGLDDGSFGTDAVRVADAIGRADAGRGVVVLMDLGSAVLSAELALDLLDPSVRNRVSLCPAPIVEGLCMAAVAAAGGAGPAEVVAEARRALAAKEEHLGTAPAQAPPGPAGATDDAAADATGRFEVTWPHGLHARPAAALVQAVRAFDADVRLRDLTAGGDPVPASSLSRVAALGAQQGHVVAVTAAGPDAAGAVRAVLDLAERGFGDLDGVDVPPPAWVGAGPLPAVAGVAVGPAWFPSVPDPVASEPDTGTSDPGAEQARLRDAIADVEKELRLTRDRTAAVAGEREARVFDAHVLLLEDPDLLDRARTAIDGGRGAIGAWLDAVAAVAAAFDALDDAYQRGRAADVRAVGAQVAAQLTRPGGGNLPADPGEPPPGAVLVAADLTPADAARLDPDRVAAVALAGGSPTAHSMILVRALGIPAVVGGGSELLTVPAGTPIAVDGGRGLVVIAPSAEQVADFQERAAAVARRRETARAHGRGPAVTRDGVEIAVGANLASVDDARAAAAAGADLAGLVRTELLFQHRSRPPTVDEQAEAYRELADALPGRRIVVRTLDVGGDKPLPYLPTPAEANPFLGVRGIRLLLRRPELLLDQLRAVVRVARDRPIDVLFPMVSTVGELLAARRALEDAARAEGHGLPAGLRVGVMVEVPAVALKARAIAAHADFLSIGTNDLTQYALAAERGNDAVAALADPLDPGVLALIAAVGQADTTVAVCGELAADELATAVLVGLGVRELSVAPSAVPMIKQAVRDVDAGRAAGMARAALAAPDAAGVRELLAGR
jgi:multiphosphoryl transfer protein